MRRFPSPARDLGESLFGARRPFFRSLQELETDPRRYLRESSADWVVGAFLCARAEAVASIGPMDERFFLYSEEIDWCLRAHQRGWDIRHLPAMTVTHHAGRRDRGDLMAQLAHSRSLFAAKHHGKLGALGIRAALAIGHVLRIALRLPLAFRAAARARIRAEAGALRVLLGLGEPPLRADPPTRRDGPDLRRGGVAICAASSGRRAATARSTGGWSQAMCAGLEHRGPDSRGVHVDGAVGLGIQRLRVIDLETGDQPVYNEDRSVAVVLNGEIYNYRELRERLRANGHRFATDGDTEVIAHLYEEEGPGFVRSLSGMFAIAIWDARRQELFVARDRIGKKPLFYAARDGAISFASELWALLADGEVSREVDPVALDRFLTYTYVPSPFSAFRAVRKLPPGSLLRWRDGEPRRRALLEARVRAEARGGLGGRGGGAGPRRGSRGGPAPPGRRRPARRLPLRRRRLDRGGGGDGRALERPGQDLLDRLRVSRLRRASLRA